MSALTTILCALTAAHEEIGRLRSHDSSTVEGYDVHYWAEQARVARNEADQRQSDVYRMSDTLLAYGLRSGDRPVDKPIDPNASVREKLSQVRDLLSSVGSPNFINAIKAVRSLTGSGLKEAKDLLQEFPGNFPPPSANW